MLETEPDFKLLDGLLHGDAAYIVSLNRDQEKGYAFEIEHSKKTQGTRLKKTDILNSGLLPTGSNWSQAVGWRSYFGLPITFHQREWIAVGMTKIFPLSNGRAYPISISYIFPYSELKSIVIPKLETLQKSISPSNIKREVTEGLFISDIRLPSEYLDIEAMIIYSAIQNYLSTPSWLEQKLQTLLKNMGGKYPLLLNRKFFKEIYRFSSSKFLFRTLIISETQIDDLKYPGPNNWGIKTGYLMGITTSIMTAFSKQSRRKLRASQSKVK